MIPSDGLLDLANIVIEWASHILSVEEDEGLFEVEAHSEDILAVFNTVFHVLLYNVSLFLDISMSYFQRIFSLEEKLLVIGDLDNKRNVESVL